MMHMESQLIDPTLDDQGLLAISMDPTLTLEEPLCPPLPGQGWGPLGEGE